MPRIVENLVLDLYRTFRIGKWKMVWTQPCSAVPTLASCCDRNWVGDSGQFFPLLGPVKTEMCVTFELDPRRNQLNLLLMGHTSGLGLGYLPRAEGILSPRDPLLM